MVTRHDRNALSPPIGYTNGKTRAFVIGLVLTADLLRRNALSRYALIGGIFLGAGAFQLYDGTLQHKLLHLHEIRYGVNPAPYDWTWNILAVILILVGVFFTLRKPHRETSVTP